MAPLSSTKHAFRSGKPAHSQRLTPGPSMKRLALLFLAVILAAQPVIKVAGMELPAGRRSAGNRRLLDDTVVSDYTKYCTPARDTTPDNTPNSAAYVTVPYDIASLQTGVDLCNYEVFKVNGQPVKLPSTITGTVTETALSDGRLVTLALQVSGVHAQVGGASLEELMADPNNVKGYILLGVNYYSISHPPDTSGLSTEEFFKTLALVQSLTYTLVFELHDNSKPGDPITTNYNDIFNPPTPELTFVSEHFANLVIEGPLRPSPLFPNIPVGNPAVFTINQLALGNGSVFNDVSLNILSPDDGSVLATLKKEFAKYSPEYLSLGVDPPANATATPTPTGTATSTPTSTATPVPTGTSAATATPVPTGTSASAGRAPVNGVCDPYGSAPNQCFSAAGGASICCPGQCPTPGANPSCTGSVTAAPTTGTPSPTGTPSSTGTPSPTTSTGPTPTPTASASGAPSTVCDAYSARPNQCFNANGTTFICCAGACGASGTTPVCAT